jgi:hypothetical protein
MLVCHAFMEKIARVVTQAVDHFGYNPCQESHQPEIVDNPFQAVEVDSGPSAAVLQIC